MAGYMNSLVKWTLSVRLVLFLLLGTLLKMGCFVYTFKGVLTVMNTKLPLGCLSTPMHV